MRSFGLFVIAVLTAVLFAYPATASPASVVATINGGGTAIMDPSRSRRGPPRQYSRIHTATPLDGRAYLPSRRSRVPRRRTRIPCSRFRLQAPSRSTILGKHLGRSYSWCNGTRRHRHTLTCTPSASRSRTSSSYQSPQPQGFWPTNRVPQDFSLYDYQRSRGSS